MPPLINKTPLSLIAAAHFSADGTLITSFGCFFAFRIDVGFYAMLIAEEVGVASDKSYLMASVQVPAPSANKIGYMALDFSGTVKADAPLVQNLFPKGLVTYEIIGGNPVAVDRACSIFCLRSED